MWHPLTCYSHRVKQTQLIIRRKFPSREPLLEAIYSTLCVTYGNFVSTVWCYSWRQLRKQLEPTTQQTFDSIAIGIFVNGRRQTLTFRYRWAVWQFSSKRGNPHLSHDNYFRQALQGIHREIATVKGNLLALVSVDGRAELSNCPSSLVYVFSADV